MSTENNDAVSTLSSNSREASPPTSVVAKYIVILVVVSLGLVFFGVKPALEGYFNNNSKITQQQEANKSNEATLADLMRKKSTLNNTKTEVDDFLKSFPSSADQQAMLTELNSIAAKNRVTIGSIAPTLAAAPGAAAPAPAAGGTAKPSSDLVAAINIDMSLTGGDPNGFLSDLEKSKRVFVINSLSYTGEKENKTMAIKATTYVVQPLVNPDTAIAPAEGAVAPPVGDQPPVAPAPGAPIPAPAAPSSGS